MRCLKKMLPVLLVVVMVFSMLPMRAEAATEGYYTYDVFDGEATITACDTSITGDVTIPSTLGGYPVTYIGSEAFAGCTSLQSVEIGGGVTSIGNYAFSNCTSLQSVVIPGSVTSVGIHAFSFCPSLQNVTLKNGVTSIGKYAFSRCNTLQSVVIPDSVTSIGKDAFYGTAWYNSQPNGLVYAGKVAYKYKGTCPPSVVLKEGTLGIAGFAFRGCDSLQSVVIPEGATSIGEGAFCDCISLQSVVIPDSVTSIEFRAFSNCSSLQTITFKGNAPAFEDDVLTDTTAIAYYPKNDPTWDDIVNSDIFPGITWVCGNYESSEQPSGGSTVSEVQQKIGDIQLGPYGLKGATINILGYEIPLVDLEAKITLDIGGNLKIVGDTGKTVQVLIGFDEDAKANINGASSSTKYWSESYREVKDMYKQIAGRKVDTTRLWNKFTSLRGKLKKMDASLIVGVDAFLGGYAEFTYENGELVFSEGGLIAEFDAKTSLRSYYGPAYVTLGLEVGADGTLIFADRDGLTTPQIKVSPELTVFVGAGIGTKSTYTEVDAYGTLFANIATNSDVPFEAGLDMGVRWVGYLLGKEVFSNQASFAKVELYPNFGDPWAVSLMSLTPEVDVSSVEVYNELINAAEPISRDYLAKPYSLRSLSSFRGASFVKQNAYPLNKPNLVCFDNGTMLLVWIDDTGEKTSENMCSIMYAYYDGTNWSDPAVLFEDGTANDMPCVYSDGRYAYIVWQKASRVFESGVETTDMLPYFDLYAMVFDQSTQTFTDPICVNADENTAFEFEPAIYGENGTFTVAWLENSDNNVYQMSGENTLCASSFNADGELLEEKEILTTTNMFTGLEIGQDCVYYSIQENESNNLYVHNSEPMLLAEAISAFDYCNGLLFYSNTTGFNAYDGSSYTSYDNIGVIDDFMVAYGNGRYALFASVLNEDFSKDLYYSLGENGTWSNFEVYSSNGKYIRDYSPVVLSDGAVRVAFNYVEEDMQSATIVVNQCTDDVDIVVEYVDFEDESLGTGSVDLQIGIKNNSSTAMESFVVSVLDSEGNEICTQEATGILPAFGEYELVIGYTLPDDYNGEVYSIQVLPADYFDLDETNNTVNTTFECIHDYSGVWLTTVVPAKGEDGAQVLKCTKCSEVLEERVLPGGTFEKLTRTLSLTDVIYINQYVGITGFDGIDLTSKGGMISWVGTELSAEEAVIGNAIVTNLQGLKYDSAKSRFGQQSTGIYSNQYGKTVYMRFYVEIADGLYAYSDIYTDSVVSYCDTVLQKSSNAKQKDTCAALLYYGAAAEVYFDKKTDGLVSDYVPDGYEFTYDESLIDALKETPATTLPVNDSLVSKFGHTLSLVEAIRINYNAPAAQTAKARLLLWYEDTESLDADNYDYDIEMTWDSSKNRYSAQSDLVFSVSMGNTIYACVEFTDAAGNVTYSGIDVYSAESYAETVINNSSNAAMVDLCKKMVIYGEMAKILFAN